MTKFIVHNHLHLPTQDARDAELNYSIVMKGWMFRYNGANYGPFKERADAEAKLDSLKG